MYLVPKLPKKVQFLLDWSFPLVSDLTPRNPFNGGRPGYAKEVLFTWLLVKKITNWDYRTVADMAGISHPTLIRANDLFLKRQVYQVFLRTLVKRAYKTGLIKGKKVALDSSFVKTYSRKGESGSGKWNAKKEAYGFKLHLLIDAETGYPIALIVGDGTTHDSQLAIPLLKKARPWLKKVGYVLADKGYDSGEIVFFIADKLHAKAGIPIKKTNQKKGNHKGGYQNWKLKAVGRTVKHSIYRFRSEVERCFSTLKRPFHLGQELTRGIVAFTKNVHLALICFMLRRLHVVGERRI